MKIVSAAEMLNIEKAAQGIFHIMPLILMENAGKEAALFIKNTFSGDMRNKRIAIFAGKGNNAGDGFVLARHLCNMGAQVRVFLLNKTEDFSQDALQNYRILQNMPVRIQTLALDRDLQTLKVALMYTDLIVDAVFGTGFLGAPPPFVGKVFDIINSSGLPVMALDIPSGVEADTGKVYAQAVKAKWTLAMGLPKLGLVLNDGSNYAGEIIVVDISLPRSLLVGEDLKRSLITTEICRNFLPQRSTDSHKGSYGHLLIAGGSLDMVGAAVLAAQASARSGCGLVTLALPQGLQQAVAPQIPHIMTKGLSQTEKLSLSKDAFKELEPSLGRMQAMVIGQGISRHPDTMQFVRKVIENIKIPLVIDADALFAIKGKLDLLKNCSAPVVLTPHPGEMAALLDRPVEEIQKSRLEIAEHFAQEYGITLVLKGHHTIVASPLSESYIGTRGNAGMAKGGSGDVLAGIIGALLARGITPVQAAVIGVHVHGRSGDLCAEKLSMQGMHALDIIENLTDAWLEIEK